jgi:hypothetical protein
VEREELVEALRPEHLGVGRGELRPDEQRLDARGDEERERRDEVVQADPLVVGRRQVAEQAARLAPDALQPLDPGLGDGRQRSSSR